MAHEGIVKRNDFADYLNVGTKTEPIWALLGVGVTALNESPGAQTSSKTYVHEASATTTTRSYNTTFPFTTDLIADDEAVSFIYNVARDHKTGDAAVTDYVRVEAWREGTSPGSYTARKFRVAVAIDNISGAGGEEMVMSGNLNAQGDPEDGEWNKELKKFISTAEAGE